MAKKDTYDIYQVDEVNLTLVRDFYLVGKNEVRTSRDAVDIFRQFWEENLINIQEQMSVMLLNRANKVVGMYQHSTGSITGTVADVELICAVAIKALAKGVIIAHNHPSGNLNASQADIQLTKQLEKTLAIAGIVLIDSLILVPDKTAYRSLKDEGDFEQGGAINSSALHLGDESENDYGTFEIFKNGGKVEVSIGNSDESYDKERYSWLLNDFDKDGVINADDHNPVSASDSKQIDKPSLSVGLNFLLNLKQTMDKNMYEFVDELKNVAPDGSKIYARTKTPYSILNKMITKRLTNPKTGLNDLIGTTIVTDSKQELDRVRDVINSGKLGTVIEFEDMYDTPKGGYRAYHFLVDRNGMSVEVQLKTRRQKALNQLSHEPYKLKQLDAEKLLRMSKVADLADNGDQDAIREYDEFMSQPNIERVFYLRKGGYLALGGQPDILAEEDFVWNALGKKMIVREVTDTEYFLDSFGQVLPMPFDKKKVDKYIREGVWSLKPKYVGGGITKDQVHIIRERVVGRHLRKHDLEGNAADSTSKVTDAKIAKTDAGDMRVILHLENRNTEAVPVSKWSELLNGRAVGMGVGHNSYVLQLRDVMAEGGGVDSKYQIRNSSGEYFSVDMSTRQPKWERGVDWGYMYSHKEAEKVKEQLENMGYADLQIVPYEPHKSVMGVKGYEDGGMMEDDGFYADGGEVSLWLVGDKAEKLKTGTSRAIKSYFTKLKNSDQYNEWARMGYGVQTWDSSVTKDQVEKYNRSQGYSSTDQNYEYGGMMAKGGGVGKIYHSFTDRFGKVYSFDNYMDFATFWFGLSKKAQMDYFPENYTQLQRAAANSKEARTRVHGGQGAMMESGGMVDGADGLSWQKFKEGDSALVKDENKLGTIVKAYGRKFHLRFPDGFMKTYDAQDLMFLQEDEYAEGGYMGEPDEFEEEGVDLFEHPEQVPPEVQEILDEYSEAFMDGRYNDLALAKEDLENIGYTFDFYLDGVPYDLRKIGQKGKSETSYALGGQLSLFEGK